MSLSVANVPEREEEREEMLAEWLACPHLPFPNLLAPPTCLCTVTGVTLLDGALKQATVGRMVGKEGMRKE